MAQPRLACFVIVCILAGAVVSHGAPLDLIPLRPDITSGLIDIEYIASSGAFTADGLPFMYYGPPLPDGAITPGFFDLDATISASGVASSGSLLITGTTLGGSGTGVFGDLLTGDLLDFGFAPDGSSGAPIFEFLFAVTGGQLESDFDVLGATIGVILTSGDTSFPGGFGADYSLNSHDFATSNTFIPMPEPASVFLTLVGLAGIVIRKRRAVIRSRHRN